MRGGYTANPIASQTLALCAPALSIAPSRGGRRPIFREALGGRATLVGLPQDETLMQCFHHKAQHT